MKQVLVLADLPVSTFEFLAERPGMFEALEVDLDVSALLGQVVSAIEATTDGSEGKGGQE